MYLLFVFLPLSSFLIAFFFSPFIGKKGTCFITSFFLGLTAFISLFIFYEIVLCDSNCYIVLFNWFQSGFLNIVWYIFDNYPHELNIDLKGKFDTILLR